MCTFKTSPFVPAQRAHMFQHVCAWCRYTRGHFERTHGDVFSGHTGFSACHTHTPRPQRHTQHNTTTRPQHHTETETETDRDRQRQRKKTGTEREEKTEEERQDKRREKINFAVWWCMAFFVGVVIFLFIPFAHETLAS